MENTYVDKSNHALAFALLGTGRVRITADCWFWTGPRIAGHGVFWIGGIMWKAHEAAMVLFKGGLKHPRGQHVCQVCGNLSCIAPKHIFYADRIEAKPNPFRQLNKYEIAEIVKGFRAGIHNPVAMAQAYGVSEWKIRQAVTGHPGSWANARRFVACSGNTDRRD